LGLVFAIALAMFQPDSKASGNAKMFIITDLSRCLAQIRFTFHGTSRNAHLSVHSALSRSEVDLGKTWSVQRKEDDSTDDLSVPNKNGILSTSLPRLIPISILPDPMKNTNARQLTQTAVSIVVYRYSIRSTPTMIITSTPPSDLFPTPKPTLSYATQKSTGATV
jgi:hypothetical protein